MSSILHATFYYLISIFYAYNIQWCYNDGCVHSCFVIVFYILWAHLVQCNVQPLWCDKLAQCDKANWLLSTLLWSSFACIASRAGHKYKFTHMKIGCSGGSGSLGWLLSTLPKMYAVFWIGFITTSLGGKAKLHLKLLRVIVRWLENTCWWWYAVHNS